MDCFNSCLMMQQLFESLCFSMHGYVGKARIGIPSCMHTQPVHREYEMHQV